MCWVLYVINMFYLEDNSGSGVGMILILQNWNLDLDIGRDKISHPTPRR